MNEYQISRAWAPAQLGGTPVGREGGGAAAPCSVRSRATMGAGPAGQDLCGQYFLSSSLAPREALLAGLLWVPAKLLQGSWRPISFSTGPIAPGFAECLGAHSAI